MTALVQNIRRTTGPYVAGVGSFLLPASAVLCVLVLFVLSTPSHGSREAQRRANAKRTTTPVDKSAAEKQM